MDILSKLWESDASYHEPVCFSENAQGDIVGGILLFDPEDEIQLTSSDGETTYIKDRDYKTAGRKIILTAGSGIPVLKRDVFCRPYTGEPETAWVRTSDGNSYIAVISDLYAWQLSATYKHKGHWNGIIPSCSHTLSESMRKLISGEEVHLTFFGDSITAGWEASGCDELAVDMVTLEEYHVSLWHAPYMPSWAELVTNRLRQQFPDSHIIKANCAAGGSGIEWGVKHAAQLVNRTRPDLAVLAFGMNSMQEDPESYKLAIESMINQIRSACPLCEFILVSPMIPNPEIAGFQNNHLADDEQMLFRIQKEMSGVCAAPVNSVFGELTRRGKSYYELSGNCINHPNDYSVRIYAQTILSTLGI